MPATGSLDRPFITPTIRAVAALAMMLAMTVIAEGGDVGAPAAANSGNDDAAQLLSPDDSSADALPLLCVGGSPMTAVVENQQVIISFQHAPAGGAPEESGECSLADRPFAADEPSRLVYAGGGQTAGDLARLAAQPTLFRVIAVLKDGELQVTSLVVDSDAGGLPPRSEASVGAATADANDSGAAASDDGPGTDASAALGGDIGGPATTGMTGPGAATAEADTNASGIGPSDGGPGTEANAALGGDIGGPGTTGIAGPGSDSGLAADSSSAAPGVDETAVGPGSEANAPGAAAAEVTAFATDFSGKWQISGNYGEHFTLMLSSQVDGTVTGTYFTGKAGAFPKGDILAGQVAGDQLLAQYKYQPAKGQSDGGEILFTMTGPGSLSALWTNGSVSPTPDTADGTWEGVRSAGDGQP